jgi:Na+-translocating ferredoxin:NAD+ oxidoreductase RnfG subunit
MKKSDLMPTIVLSTICICVVALLAAINLFTAPVIKKNQEIKAREALLEVMPNGNSFEKINDISDLPDCITEAHRSENGGFVFQAKVKGFKTGLVIVCGIDKDGNITGAKCIQSQETNGAEKLLGKEYLGKTVSDYETVEIIARSTMTSKGYKEAIRASFDAFNILTGGNK